MFPLYPPKIFLDLSHVTDDERPSRRPTRIARFFLFSAFCLLLSTLLSCRATPTRAPSVHFRIGTADSTQYIAREAANAYLRAHPTTTFDFFTGNSTTALRQLAFDQCDFAFTERNPRADELERAGATALELGRDAAFIIVHPSNPLQNVSRDNLKKIMTGEINLWSQLGIAPPGDADEIQVLAREEGSGMRAVVDEKVLQGARVTPTALLQPTNLDMLDYVAKHPNALGYVAANMWNDNSRTRALSIDNVVAARTTIQAGTYPLLQTVFLIIPQSPTLGGKKRVQSSANIASFLDFLSGSEGRSILYQRITELPPK
jgi:phosphate transport system substrate-binding protein